MDAQSGSTSSWEYVDFELEIGEGGPRKYPVTVRSAAGEAQEEMRFPFDEWELENKLLTLENTLLRSGETRRRIPSQEEQPVQDFGMKLLQALLVGEVRTRYEVSLREARRQNKGLRLKLRVNPADLARLPWEFLYDPDRDEYLSLSSKTPLVRYLPLHQPIEQLPVSPPLRILGMVSSPLDLPELDVEHEKRLMEEAIMVLRTSGLVEMTWLEGQTWSDLQQAMWGGPWHVFHFIGHGGFDEASEEGAIALANDAGRKHLLGARNLARLLDDHYPLRLAFLNSCEGARGSARDAFSSTATTLVRRGIPAVVAMQYEITDKAAIAFSRVFYRAVAAGLPVDAAVATGRTAVSMESALEWGTPVLYMRSPDGRIFDISTATSAAQTEEVTDWKELERRTRLDELYAQARQSHRNHEWQRVINIFEQIRAEDPTYPDSEEFLTSAREALEAQEHTRRVNAVYAEGRRHMDAGEWQQALERLEEAQRLEPGYRDTDQLLSQVRQELAPPSTVEVPDLAGQEVSRATSTLTNKGLELGAQTKVSSETVSNGQIIKQSPEAGTEIRAGGSVSVTVSSGTREAATVQAGQATRSAGQARSRGWRIEQTRGKWVMIAITFISFLVLALEFLFLHQP
jgi:tetratricopeptide (TPR) repeat protein